MKRIFVCDLCEVVLLACAVVLSTVSLCPTICPDILCPAVLS